MTDVASAYKNTTQYETALMLLTSYEIQTAEEPLAKLKQQLADKAASFSEECLAMAAEVRPKIGGRAGLTLIASVAFDLSHFMLSTMIRSLPSEHDPIEALKLFLDIFTLRALLTEDESCGDTNQSVQ